MLNILINGIKIMLGTFFSVNIYGVFLIEFIKSHYTCSSTVDLVDEIKSILIDKNAFRCVRIDSSSFSLKY